jgi:hypothetical protein
MPVCPNCHAEAREGERFCARCGSSIAGPSRRPDIVIVTTPTVPGYRLTAVLGVVTGLTARTRGVGGRFVAGIQSMVGGEVSAFTYEIEKARYEAMERLRWSWNPNDPSRPWGDSPGTREANVHETVPCAHRR